MFNLIKGGRSGRQLQECVREHDERAEVQQTVHNGRIGSFRVRSPAQLENRQPSVITCHVLFQSKLFIH